MSVNWSEVARDGKAAFAKFTDIVSERAKQDPRWGVTKLSPTLAVNYSELGGTERAGMGLEAIAIAASMNEFSSSGHLFIRGPEQWEFARSEQVGNIAAAALTEMLQRAGLQPVPGFEREQEGRRSYWSVMWRLYPLSHPKLK